MTPNLNQLTIRTDCLQDDPLEDFSVEFSGASGGVVFRDLEDRLIRKIKECDVVVGCVAWLTNQNIILALAEKDCSIVVQKEDFLRPDIRSPNSGALTWAEELRILYSRMKCGIMRCAFDGLLSSLNSNCDLSIEPVRCVGNHNVERDPAFPRMHNKFMVFCRLDKVDHKADWGKSYEIEVVRPLSVWTGSFNLTYNATMSFENAVIIDNAAVAEAYLKEFSQIFALSERLDWNSPWVSPEFRVGT